MTIDLTSLSAKELNTLIKSAKKQHAIVAKRASITKVRAQLTKMARTEGYSIAELFGGAAAPAATKTARKSLTKTKKSAIKKIKSGKVAPKYRNTDNPKEVWTGRGKQPRWMMAHLAAGKSREDFLIEK